MKAKENSGGNFDIDTGLYPAVCCGVIDIGTQHGEYNGKPKVARKIILKFELLDETYEDKEGNVKRKHFSQFCTLSLDKRATLRKLLVGWRGQQFTKEELDGFEMKNVIGKPCVLTVGLNEKGKTIIEGITKYKGDKVKMESDAEYFSLDPEEFEGEFPEWMSEGLEKLVVLSDEYRAFISGGAEEEIGQHAPAVSAEDDDDIPF